MPLQPGDRLGVYEVIGPLGAGAMGEVYRARDTRLDRDVAIKVLPEFLATDRDRLLRFDREARALAALNHPNVAQIYGTEYSGSVRAIVMELVAGETLADRLARGSVPLREAIPIARQIADGLAAAHDAGVVHRDLKPANVKLRPDGIVKVLDFGLAKPAEVTADSPTITGDALTHAGTILGTTAYMSPEQARGSVVDKRTDVWAFGCVLYEMLTGRRAFPGDTIPDAIGRILEREPDWSALPPDTPASVVQVLHRCLEKDAKRRLRDPGDASLALEDSQPDTRIETSRPPFRAATLFLVPLLLIVAGLAGWIAASLFRRDAAAAPAWTLKPVRFEVEPAQPQSVAVADDGRTMAWVAIDANGRRRIRVRSLDSPQSVELAGTDGATAPFLAPDGHAVGFFAGGQLKRIDVATGTIKVLASTPGVSLGGTWSRQDVIVFSSRYGLQSIPADGGVLKEVASLDRARHENSLRWPQFLPDGRRFLYVARSGRPEENGAYVGSLDGHSTFLFNTLSKLVFAAPSHILFLRGDTLVARRFDTESLEVQGEESPLVTAVDPNPLGVGGGFAASSTGVLLFGPRGPEAKVALRWFDRYGTQHDEIGAPDLYPQFRIAPDGRRIAAAVADPKAASRSVWILEQGKTAARLTLPGTNDWFPVWSPTGDRVAFGSYRDGPLNIYVKAANGSGADTALILSSDQKDPQDWSPDGKDLMFRDTERDLKGDLLIGEIANPAKRVELSRSEAEERSARFSPDGRWVAYVTDETGRPEVWVQPFPPTGAKWQITVAGGDEPTWSHDGAELFYIDPDGKLVGIPVVKGPATFAAGTPRPLFRVGAALGGAGSMRYDISPDGTRFLVAVPVDTGPLPRAAIILNWPALLRSP